LILQNQETFDISVSSELLGIISDKSLKHYTEMNQRGLMGLIQND
jgi:hypothetical protein